MYEPMGWPTIILMTVIYMGLSTIPIFFTAWVFSRSFRTKERVEILGNIRDELKKLNEHGA